ncbi:hypothetical protein [Rhodococcus tibetensis]|uniref:Minor tail protein n=1 Tax=Rhodococcus tibetensis TaxID=2965064 RepID=A0ABT1QCC4_9NOCA|nr:hypothetical protein [Rhodococcus sp. FXJ9.536]MCQ4119901.1 hypothetical protein [Rhodococcus sp. FXJ9.536]
MTIVNSSFILPTGEDLETGTLTYTRTDLLAGAGGAIVAPIETVVNIVDGDGASPDIQSGPYEVRVEAGWYLDTFKIVVPATGPVDLMDLIEEFVTYEPQVIGQVQQLVAQAQGLAAAQDEAIAAKLADPDSETRTTANSIYAPATGIVKTALASTVQTSLGKADTSAQFSQLARNPDLLIAGTITRNSNEAAISAPVVWPDGTPGTYTATTLSASFPGAVDAYTITYGSPVTKTYAQPAVTRNAAGAATAVPAIVVS